MTHRQTAYTLRAVASFVVVIFSLFMVGSCKVSGDAPFDVDYSDMSGGERSRYASALSSLLSADPTILKELSARDLRIVFQNPEIERDEESSVFWQFVSNSCVLDVFFNSGANQVSDSLVAYYEIRPRHTLTAKNILKDVSIIVESDRQSDCLSGIAKHAVVMAKLDTGNKSDS